MPLNHFTTAGNDTAAHLVAASTNWQATPTVVNTTQALTTTMTRYSFTGTVPTGCTQLGLLLTWTPSGTAGADDSITINGIQLEIGGSPSSFEHRDIQVELDICQRYCWVVNEPAAGVIVGVGGAVAAANNQVFYLATPVQLEERPGRHGGGGNVQGGGGRRGRGGVGHRGGDDAHAQRHLHHHDRYGNRRAVGHAPGRRRFRVSSRPAPTSKGRGTNCTGPRPVESREGK